MAFIFILGLWLTTSRLPVEAAAPDAICGGSDWTYFSNTDSCFFVSPETGKNAALSWTEALSYCKQMGAELASIGTKKENSHVVKMITKRSRNFWIGMNNINSNVRSWVDGSPIKFTKWNQGEPNSNSGREHCVDMNTAGFWKEESCNNKQGFVCKKCLGEEETCKRDTTRRTSDEL